MWQLRVAKTRGSHLYVACWIICDRDQNVWSAKSEALDRLIFRVKGQIAAACSWSIDFNSLEVTLIPWLAPKKGVDRLIQFWSQQQIRVTTNDEKLYELQGRHVGHIVLSAFVAKWLKHLNKKVQIQFSLIVSQAIFFFSPDVTGLLNPLAQYRSTANTVLSAKHEERCRNERCTHRDFKNKEHDGVYI